MASDKEIRKMMDELQRLKRQIASLRAKIRRRFKKLENTLDPLERQRVEYEIELLKGEIRRYEIVEMRLSIPLMKAIGNLPEVKLEDKVDWSKAGKA